MGYDKAHQNLNINVFSLAVVVYNSMSTRHVFYIFLLICDIYHLLIFQNKIKCLNWVSKKRFCGGKEASLLAYRTPAMNASQMRRTASKVSWKTRRCKKQHRTQYAYLQKPLIMTKIFKWKVKPWVLRACHMAKLQ